MADPKAGSKCLFLCGPASAKLRYESEKQEHHPEWLIRTCMRFEMLELALELMLSTIRKVSFFLLPIILSPHTIGTPTPTGGVASRTGTAQNGNVDLAAVHAHRPAPRRDERADAEQPVQARDGAPSGPAPGSFEWRAESAKTEPSTVPGIVIFLSRTFYVVVTFFLSTGNNINHFRINFFLAPASTKVDSPKARVI